MPEKDQETLDTGGEADGKREPGPVTKWVDDEFAGEHGTTMFEGSEKDDAAEGGPEAPSDPGLKEGLVDKVTRAVHEVDRQVSGEYERREDPTAP